MGEPHYILDVIKFHNGYLKSLESRRLFPLLHGSVFLKPDKLYTLLCLLVEITNSKTKWKFQTDTWSEQDVLPHGSKLYNIFLFGTAVVAWENLYFYSLIRFNTNLIMYLWYKRKFTDFFEIITDSSGGGFNFLYFFVSFHKHGSFYDYA